MKKVYFAMLILKESFKKVDFKDEKSAKTIVFLQSFGTFSNFLLKIILAKKILLKTIFFKNHCFSLECLLFLKISS